MNPETDYYILASAYNKTTYELKRLIFLFISLLLFVLNSNAQFESERQGYGMKLGLNYTTIGGSYDIYSGGVQPNFAIFYSHLVGNHLNLIVEPGFTSTQFKEKQSDTRYNSDYLDFSFMSMIYPSSVSKDFGFMIGLRPSYLIAYSTQTISNGSYQTIYDETNKNKTGDMNFSGLIGISVALSPAISFELGYSQSFTSKTDESQIKGRPSTVELSLRINAVNLRDQLKQNQMAVKEEVAHRQKGSLLVMLQTPNPSEINSLKKDSNMAEIALIEGELNLRNSLIIKRFRENFSFCPIYFFMDTSAYKVMAKNLNGIFVNDRLQPDSSIKVDTANFFVASFCSDNSNYTHRLQYGLYAYNDQIVQLGKPYNHPSQLISSVSDADPVMYFKKRTNYSKANFGKLIAKFNNRLLRYAY